MKKAFLLLACFTCPFVYAQTDSVSTSIEDRISKTQLIQNARKLLLDTIVEGDKEEAEEIFEYLVSLEDENYESLFITEKWLFEYWTENFRLVLIDVLEFQKIRTTYSEDESIPQNVRILPEQDYLFIKLKERLQKEQIIIKESLNSIGMENFEKDFLYLLFEDLLFDFQNQNFDQDSLNRYSNQYLVKYPDSPFNSFIKEFIRVEFEPSYWGFGFEFFSGYGIFTDQLQTNFANHVPIGIAFDVQYKSVVLYLRNYIGLGRTSMPIDFGGTTWRDNAQTRIFLPEASIGYELVSTDYFKFTPFVGISATDISPTEYDLDRYEEYENVGLDFTTTYSFGLNLDIKLKTSSSGILARNEDGSWNIRLRYSFNQPQFANSYPDFTGNFHYLTVGISGFARKLKRVK